MEEHKSETRKVCVTGAGGFIASWLVKLLLSKGYVVHGTLRDPSDEKNAHLKKLDKATENLRLFKADLLDYDAIKAAISGCQGVFHAASPVVVSGVTNPEVELISPAVTGTKNVLKACSETNVKRVVVVSSLAAVACNPNWPQGTVMDENCWSDEEYCKATEDWYSLSKTMAEKETFKYAQEKGLDVVTICPSICIGPLLQSTVNTSSLFLINILKGTSEYIEKFQNCLFVDVRDVTDAALLIFEKKEASGRYICTLDPILIVDLFDVLKNMFPGFKHSQNNLKPGLLLNVSSEKLKKIGWKCRPLSDSITDSVQYYEETGILSLE